MGASLISPDNTWALWAVVAIGAAASIWLEQTYQWAAKMSGCLIALLLAMLLSNIGLIPTDAPVYDAVWGYVVPLALPLLLVNTNLRHIAKESGSFLFIFLVGAIGTVVGAILGYNLLCDYVPEMKGIAGMMTGTYIGGSVNLAALADSFGVSGKMVSAATVADNLTMGVYFFVLIAMPAIPLVRKLFKHPIIDEQEKGPAGDHEENRVAAFWKAKNISLLDIALCGALSFFIVTASTHLASFLTRNIPTGNVFLEMCNSMIGNKYLWITTISVALATAFPKFMTGIKGTQEIGTYFIYFFFFAIGVPASIPVIIQNSPILFVFTVIMVSCNMFFMFVVGYFFKIDLETIILASNANIGGPTTAAGMAIAKGWHKLIGPCLIIGTFGYVIGTYLGLMVGNL